ncbi:MAG: 50S ribosomal protein L5 [Candidatus Schekmanbacteria bacterium]|nr:MAG: 50S ribosomal protein L5 [Candidatus Schekmanbacteria bacterium]
MARLKELYRKEIINKLMEEGGYKNVMEVPKMEKIVLNIGVGEAIQNSKALESAMNDLAAISGQKPSIRRAKKSISNFKLRSKMAIGCKVTLRGDRMYEFFDRLVNAAIPRIRDFRGVSGKAFDGRGNYTLGIREQIIFPEIVYDKIDKLRGLNITIVTTAKTDKEAKLLLKHLGMPFRN